MTGRQLPLWRSLLYVPVNVPRFVNKAHLRGADAIILDLEDSIVASEKAQARKLVRDAARSVSRNGADVVVRINAPLSLAVRDLEASVYPEVHAINLPKIESGAQIELLSDCVAALEQERGLDVGRTRFKVIIETAKGFMALQEILRAVERDPRVCAINLGSEDFALSTRMIPEPDALYVPNMLGVIGAHSVGVLPLGFIGSVAQISDLDGFRQIVRRSRRLGFVGASCVHPAQVPILNEEFGVSEQEAEWARRVIDAAEASVDRGQGAFLLDGEMVDRPVIERARSALERYNRIRERGLDTAAAGGSGARE